MRFRISYSKGVRFKDAFSNLAWSPVRTKCIIWLVQPLPNFPSPGQSWFSKGLVTLYKMAAGSHIIKTKRREFWLNFRIRGHFSHFIWIRIKTILEWLVLWWSAKKYMQLSISSHAWRYLRNRIKKIQDIYRYFFQAS